MPVERSGSPNALMSRIRGDRLALALCFITAVVEGFDIQSFGLAAPDIRTAFAMSPTEVGLLASGAVLGLVFGTIIGGRLADIIGRKLMLIACVGAVGLFTIGTALVTSTEVMLVMRLLTGFGLGGAMPNLIALSAEAGGEKGRIARVTFVIAGVPLGGFAAGLFGATPWAAHWQGIFLFGGGLALTITPLLALGLPDRVRAAAATENQSRPQVHGYATVLFGEGRAVRTMWLWLAFIATQLVFYLLMNWLPVIVRDAGFDRAQSALSIAAFNIGGMLGGIYFGKAMETRWRWAVPLVTYGGVLLALVLFSFLDRGIWSIYAICLFKGACIIGSQLVLFGLAAEAYDTSMRGTGVGATTAVGRLGGSAGPLVGGALLGAGGTAAALLPVLVPLTMVACMSAMILAWKPRISRERA